MIFDWLFYETVAITNVIGCVTVMETDAVEKWPQQKQKFL
jgi:hypothetical protein